MSLAIAVTFGVLFGCGVHLMIRGDAVRLAAGAILVTNSAILLLVDGGVGAVLAPLLPGQHRPLADPLAQALAITAVIIGLATTVLLLRVVLAVEETTNTIDVHGPAEDPDRERRPD